MVRLFGRVMLGMVGIIVVAVFSATALVRAWKEDTCEGIVESLNSMFVFFNMYREG